jgi:outer membrane protein
MISFMTSRTQIQLAAKVLVCGLLLLAPMARPGMAADLKIATVNVNRAINESEPGQRSKKILQATFSQKENELKAKEAQFRKLVEDTRTNMMLSDAAKQQKEKELRDKEGDLRQEVQAAQHDLQEQERKMTDAILVEIRRIIGVMAQEKKYDLVLEQAAAQVVLFSQFKMDDLTNEVIDRYNKDSSNKQ